MTSQINPNNINGDYPVPGVPNNSQGMRDNFTNTKTNFQFAATEITDLQINGVFKAALAGTTLDNNMNNNLIYAVQLSDVSWQLVTLTTTSGTISLDYSAANWYVMPSQTGNATIAFSNWPTSGTAGVLRFRIVVSNTSYTLTLPAAVSLGTAGIQGWASNVITFAATGTYDFEFSTIDGGTTVTVTDLTRPLLGSGQAAVGYGTGAGSTVTQGTSRTTGVIINAYSGAITLVSAAGSTSWQSFTVTNSRVAATDTIIVNQKSGTDLYRLHVTAVAAGSFRITFATTAGTTTEQPVFNFAVIKAVTS
jgi:hypothetical protein